MSRGADVVMFIANGVLRILKCSKSWMEMGECLGGKRVMKHNQFVVGSIKQGNY